MRQIWDAGAGMYAINYCFLRPSQSRWMRVVGVGYSHRRRVWMLGYQQGACIDGLDVSVVGVGGESWTIRCVDCKGRKLVLSHSLYPSRHSLVKET